MQATDDLGPRSSRRLTYLLKRALLTLEELHEERLATVGISVRELAVLLALSEHEPESQQQTARRLHVDRTTMVGLLDGLEGKELVARRADPADRRRNVIELTGRGVAVLEAAVQASDFAEGQLLEGLGGSDATRLRRLLARLAVERPGPDEGPTS